MTSAARKGNGGDELTPLLEYLKQNRGFDFSGYKRTSLERRIKKRLGKVGIEDYTDYQDYLEVNPDEFTELFNTILINVTAFFRDAPTWDYLRAEVVPKLIEAVPDTDPIRVWSAACASGEEAYTAAMVFAEALGEEQFHRRVKIYATDVDQDALATARLAVYSRDALEAVPEPLRERYWEPNTNGLGFRTDMRRSVIFGRNDLVQDAPISRIDLLICRNALMYFTPETQSRILSHFNFSLNPDGYLFLGKSEMLLTRGDLFTPHSLKARVFTTVQRTGIRDRLSFVASGIRSEDESSARYSRLRDGAADVTPLAEVVLDSSGLLAFANQAARALFGLAPNDIGRPIQDLELSYRPIDLRTGLARMRDERRTIYVGRMQWANSGETPRTFDVQITPVLAGGTDMLGSTITFADVTEQAVLAEQFKDSSHQLETAYEELQSTVEELETTNEELQSTNEELETTNEELQSTNEELETMNEELQSTNDELETMNEIQSERSDQMDRLNLFLEGILGNLGVGVVVLDQHQTVQIWNASATELWGLRGDEVVGKPFLMFDIGLPVDALRDSIRSALADGASASTVTIPAVNRLGKRFECTVRTLPLVTPAGEHYGVIMLMSGLDGRLPPHPVEISALDS